MCKQIDIPIINMLPIQMAQIQGLKSYSLLIILNRVPARPWIVPLPARYTVCTRLDFLPRLGVGEMNFP